MNEKIKKAIQEFEKAQKHYTNMQAYANKASQDARKAWDAVPSGSINEKRNSIEWENAHKASEHENDAHKQANLAQAILMATSQNVANIAANVVREFLSNDTNIQKIPSHYKKFKNAIENITGENDFYFTNDYNTITIYFRRGTYGHNCAWLISQNDEKIIDIERIQNVKPASETDLKTITREAKKAQKDAEKLRQEYQKLREKEKAIDEKYTSSIKYYLPHITPSGLQDDYRLF